jgi:aldose 1-epimerase
MIKENGVFGLTSDGKEVHSYILSNSNDIKIEIITFGGIVRKILVPDRNGRIDDITLGYDSMEIYQENPGYMGALIGRNSNRIKNAECEINGVTYYLNKNNDENNLHGGFKGFDKAIWIAEIKEEGLSLKHFSKDRDEYFPGNLEVEVVYSLSDENEFSISYNAKADRDTLVNMTNHAYFNLKGHNSGNISNHRVMINADRFTAVDICSVPTGEFIDVMESPFDFRLMKEIDEDIDADNEQIKFGKGYDHNWVLNTKGNIRKKACEVYEPESGRMMEVYTTKPGVQLYTGNYLNGAVRGKGSCYYQKRDGLCLETQYFPNAINIKNFPSPVLTAGDVYNHKTIYKFMIK